MADEPKTEAKDDAKAKEEPTYPNERLIADAQGFFGHPSHVVVGALNGAKKKNHTVAEAAGLINKFLGKTAGS